MESKRCESRRNKIQILNILESNNKYNVNNIFSHITYVCIHSRNWCVAYGKNKEEKLELMPSTLIFYMNFKENFFLGVHTWNKTTPTTTSVE